METPKIQLHNLHFDKLDFYKYHGAGNDFIMIDNRSLKLPLFAPEIYNAWCDRRMGVGADGVILLNEHSDQEVDFEMLYINANGEEGSMCGNGGRCIIAFAKFLGIIEETTIFSACDGLHRGKIEELPIEWQGLGNIEWISLEMGNVNQIDKDKQTEDYVLDTGSPHYVQFVEDASTTEVLEKGKAIRYNDTYKEKGINVNFIEIEDTNSLKIRTYERGVEAVTLACGTGATAAAVVYLAKEEATNGAHTVKLEAEGGPLEVSLVKKDANYQNIWLKGPAVQVYSGLLGEQFRGI